MSENNHKIDKCDRCQVRFKPSHSIWELGKKSHEKDEKYTLKEHYCQDCFTELDKDKWDS